MKNILYAFSVLIFSITLHAQDKGKGNSIKFEIKGKIKGLEKSQVYLSHYFGSNQQVIKDTAEVDETGSFVFSGEEELPQGLYFVNFSKNKLIDFVIGEPFFSFETDTLNVISNIKIINSKENEAFFVYQQKMNELYASFSKEKNNSTQKVELFKKQALDFQNKWLEENKNLFVSKLIKATLEVEIPKFTRPVLTKKDSADLYKFQYGFYKTHFFDHIDLNDERFLRSPFLQKKIDKYFEDLVVQQSDSIAKEADKLLGKVKQTDIRKYIIYKIANNYENSKIVGTEAAFVHMAEKYYIGEPELWDTSTVRQLKERVKIIKPLLIGKKFPEMYLTNPEGKLITTNTIPGKYTLVFLYDPECSHCRQETPKLVAQKNYFKTKGISVFAASIVREKDKWKKFITEFKIGDFYNGIDIHKNKNTGKEEYYTDFLKTFDVYSTPVVYLLDDKKNIIVKRIAVEDIKNFIEFYEKSMK
ncbi:MAG: hypothetical protein RJA76_1916 [Bacteroidota bacterium]|jgi:hypothetical protein